MIKENYYSDKFLNYFLLGFTNFLMEFYQVYEKNISPTWEKLKNFESWLSTFLGLHILPNTELRQGN